MVNEARVFTEGYNLLASAIGRIQKAGASVGYVMLDEQAWLERILSENIVPANLHPTADDRLLVCGTCSDDYPPCDRYAALAVFEELSPA